MLLLAALCQDEGEDSWWSRWMWVCMGKRIVGWFCGSVCWMCVFLSVRRTVKGTEPVLFAPAGRSAFEGVTQRIAAVSETCRLFNLDWQLAHHCVLSSLTHTHSLSPSVCLTCISYFYSIKWCICCKRGECVTTCECTIPPDCAVISCRHLTWLSWMIFDWNMIKFSFLLERCTANFTAVGHPDCSQVTETLVWS